MATHKPRILEDRLLAELALEHGTPLFVYDAGIVRARIAELSGFDSIRYAQKANSNLAILALVREQGALVDAVSAGEIARALRAGYGPGEIAFTADLFDRAALAMLREHPVPVNLGSAAMVEQYARLGAGREIVLRVNPGFGHGHGPKVSTGGELSKHGIWHDDVSAVVRKAGELGLDVTGLHVHIGSGSDMDHLTRVCSAMREFARTVASSLKSVSAGGGLPIPYRPGESRFDVDRFTSAWLETKASIEREIGRPIRLEVEPGRYLVAEAGVLLAEVRGTKVQGGIEFALVDAGFHNLVRPALYGAWHDISVVGRALEESGTPQAVAGPLCETADVFTQDRQGRIETRRLGAREGELLCIHDAGAYAASMGSNYNSQPLAAEVLVDGSNVRLVRRRQAIEDLYRDEILET